MSTRLPCVVEASVVVAVLSVFPAIAAAEIPNLSVAQLEKRAQAILTGKLTHIYHRSEKQGDYEYTHHLAEIVVDEVRAGQDIQPGDRVYVRYWRKRYVGAGRPEPGHYGHRGLPKAGERCIAYLKGSRADGYDALSPNGFAPLTTRATRLSPAQNGSAAER